MVSNDPKAAEFERYKLEQELELRRAELDLQHRELEIRERAAKRSALTSPLVLGIFAAAIGLAGNLVATIYNGVLEREKLDARNRQLAQEFERNLQLEGRRSEAALILEAVKTGDPNSAATNLEFFLEAGLLDHHEAELAAYVRNRQPNSGVYLPVQAAIDRGAIADPGDPFGVVVDDRHFDAVVRKEKLPVLVFFSAEWAGPARFMRPFIKQVAERNGDRFLSVRVNVDASPASAATYGIKAIPTLLLFEDGEVVSSHVGATDKESLTEWIGGFVELRSD